jgi:hypothetical protein
MKRAKVHDHRILCWYSSITYTLTLINNTSKLITVDVGTNQTQSINTQNHKNKDEVFCSTQYPHATQHIF